MCGVSKRAQAVTPWIMDVKAQYFEISIYHAVYYLVTFDFSSLESTKDLTEYLIKADLIWDLLYTLMSLSIYI